ncbi:MAG: glycerophosphodiester phosphodiesterase family protein [Pseudomonadota bacterium]
MEVNPPRRAPEWLTARPIAHRALHDGNDTVAENSLTAFQRAIESGFAIECDLQVSATGEPVVFHDPDLERMTGIVGTVRSHTPQDLASMKLAGTSDTIATLSTHLDQVAGRVPLILELKGVEGEDAGFVEGVADALKSYTGPVAVMSFDHWICAQFVKLLPNIPRGLTAFGDDDSAATHFRALVNYDLRFVSYGVADLPNRFVADAKSNNVPVITWTVRNEAQAKTTYRYADQMTFELFDPNPIAAAHG